MTTTKTAAELKAERQMLNAEIRKAERAERQAARRALLDSQHELGEWLAQSTGATTVEQVQALREVIDLDAIRAGLDATAVENSTAGQAEADVSMVESSDHDRVEPSERSW